MGQILAAFVVTAACTAPVVLLREDGGGIWAVGTTDGRP